MQKGDFIRINYVGKLENGEVFDLTFEDVAKRENIYSPSVRYKPVPVILGAGFVIPGLEKALFEMKVGEQKDVRVLPEEGFGARDPALVRTVQKKAFEKQNVEPRQGMIVDFSGLKGRIQSVSAGRVSVDFNNPLSGKTLTYHVSLVEQITDPAEQVKGILDFFGIGSGAARFDGARAIIETPVPEQLRARIAGLVLEHVQHDGEKLDAVQFVDVFDKARIAAAMRK